jgi:hypothetical protein
MKKVILAICTLAILGSANAQKGEKKFTFGIGPSLSFPTGDLSTGYGVGYGVELTGIYSVSETFEAFAQTGYSSFTGKTITVSFGSISSSSKVDNAGFIPALVGARYNNKFIAGAAVGYGSFSGGGSSSGGFAYSPQLGYNFGNFELIAHYTGVATEGSASTFFGVKGFYKF